MTNKELLYYEDALKHEENTISILESNINYLTNNEIKDFTLEQISIHKDLKNKLFNMLEGESNE